MAKKQDKFPPLTIVSGSQTLLRRRFLLNVVETQRAAGWKILEVDATVPGAVQEALDGDMFNPALCLAVVSSPEKIPLEMLERHHGSKDYLTTLLLHIEGEPDGRSKFGKAVKGVWSSVHKNFPEPSDWQASKVAVEFVQAEALRLGLVFPVPLATVLVERSGTDLGVLAFEVMKIGVLANLAGVKEIDVGHVKGGMAPIAEASAFPIADALQGRNAKKLLKAMVTLRRTSRDDPTMRVSRLLASSITKWLQASYLTDMPAKAVAEELGVHPWVYESKIAPAVQRWGLSGTVALLSDLAAAERAVLSGAQDPWVVLTTRLLVACGGR